ncbi:adenylate cyclase [Sinorhizobium kostiense]|uniref:Adenylate cyclase n=1 Tax=Sinorhizobium kostiense TaxID=76747 RepID=A0ABS4QXB2_9HYPH|nr:adenylate/guanylate cyclase domain-containing protein [Sinorhizobium kostiense]MBP2235288.1 adenylate cyclase [Sinorhizobium kostiense]
MSAADRIERRLAAIFAADVAGYTRLMGLNEVQTLRTLISHREIMDAFIVQHGGRIANTAGDSVLAEFPSVVDAVQCAIAVQEALWRENEGQSGEDRLQFRIGVHVGDVMVRGGDLLGDGVNIAARLQGLAAPGGICLSGDAYNHVRKKVKASVEDLGPQSVKNVEEPVRAYAVALGLARRPQGGTAGDVKSLLLPDKPSIAVLPFTNMSGDPEQEYFADGVVEDIITALSRIRWLFVIARNSSFTYKGKTVDIRRVGRELGVRYVLEGSIRKAGNRVRITGQLIEAETETHVWADRFDGDVVDVFALQDRVTESVVSAIEPRVQKVEIERARRKRPEHITAYDLYLRALPEFQTYTREGFLRGQRVLEDALAIDPSFADAWTALADCLGRLLISGWLEPVEEGKARVCETALRAVDLDPENGPALAMAAWALAVVGDDAERGAELGDEALRVHPNSAYVRMHSSFAFLFSGQIEKALQNLEIARRFSPLDLRAYTIFAGIANCHIFARRFSEAVHWAERAIELSPNYAVALRSLTISLAHDGQLEAARRAGERLMAAVPGMSISYTLKRPFGLPWMMDLWIEGLRKAGIPE